MNNLHSFHEFFILSHRFISQRNYMFFIEKYHFWIRSLTVKSCFWSIQENENMKTDLAMGAKTCFQNFEKLHYAFISECKMSEKLKNWSFFRFLKMGLLIGCVSKKLGTFQFRFFAINFILACWAGSKIGKNMCFFSKKHCFFPTQAHFLIYVIGSQNVGGSLAFCRL